MILRRIYIIICFLLITSCIRDVIVAPEWSEAIRFTTQIETKGHKGIEATNQKEGSFYQESYTYKGVDEEGETVLSTRSSELSTRSLTNNFNSGDKIKVLGYFLDDGEWNSTPTAAAENEIPNFMYNQDVIMDTDGSWSYSPAKYWSNDAADRYRFFAYYPTQSTSVRLITQNDDAGFPKINFTNTATTNFATQTDLLFAQTNVLAKATSTSGVDIQFEHALSKIRISGKMGVVDDRYSSKYIIKSITINAPTKATLSGSPTGASWSGHNTNADWSFDLTKPTTSGPVGTEIPKKDETPVMLVGGSDADDALLLIPHQGPIKATIVYDYYYSIRPEEPYEYIIEEITQEITLDDNLEAGKSYHYALGFSADNKEKVTVTNDLTDWGGTFDIETEVTYTYLYVEKPDFTLEYLTLDTDTLDVYFATNAVAAQVSVSFAQDSILTISPTTGNTVSVHYDDEKGWYARCIYTPALNYNNEFFYIKTGLVGIKININLIPVQPYYLMDPNSLAAYLKVPVDTTMYSNCYFITPDDQFSRKYFIPITQQIRYAQEKLGISPNSAQDVLHTTTDNPNGTWKVQLYAYDNPEPTNMLWLYNEGKVFRPAVEEGDGITGSGPDFAQHCFSITIPPNYTNYGNMIVAVMNESDEILWTWHLWITNYDPYAIYEEYEAEGREPTIIDNTLTGGIGRTFIYESIGNGGSMYRHSVYDYSYLLDRNIGATAPTYLGHGGLGNTGWIMYQYGRPTPILGYSSRFADGSTFSTIKHDVDELGKVSILEAVQNPNIIYYSESGQDWCSENIRSSVWNDESLAHPENSEDLNSSDTEPYYQKSRFDPSPLGYMLHPLKEISSIPAAWSAVKTEGNITTYKMSSGNSMYATVNINPYNGTTYLAIQDQFAMWSNSSYEDGNAGILAFDNNVFSTGVGVPSVYQRPQSPRTVGAPARCIDQFEEKRPDRHN